MRINLLSSVFFVVLIVLLSAAYAQTNTNPTMILSANDVSFFNGDQDSIDATVWNKDSVAHTFTISVFPSSLDKVFADSSLNHMTLGPGESGTFKVSFSSLFDAEFMPRKFSVTIASTEDPSITITKDVFVNILRRSPVFVTSMNTNKFSYQPGETMNISTTVVNQGGDTFEEFVIQIIISGPEGVLKRFETPITFLPEKSRNSFNNLYTFDQFSEPGVYKVDLTLKDSNGQILSLKSVNFKMGEVSKASQQETSIFGIFDVTTTITSRNEGNSPDEIKITTLIPSFTKEIFASDIPTSGMEDTGSSVRASWIFNNVKPGETVQVVYKLQFWKIWVTILIIGVIVTLAFRFVFTVKIMKRSRYLGPLNKDSEVPITIEVVNRSMHEVKDLYVRDFVPPIARIITKFDTVKPTIRETVGGTEVTWKFDSLRAGEERIMSYRIKPKMDVLGSLKLNPATVSYSTKNRQKKSAASDVVIIRTS